ncbi:MAG TPA: acetylxylan esterase [Pirellulales bacterium]|jgi:mannobiose 2-epimerase
MKHAHFPIRRIAALVSLYFAAGVCHAQDLLVTPDKPEGVYEIGEPIHWNIQWKGEGGVSEATYSIKENGKTDFAKGTVPITDGSGSLSGKLDEPGSLLVEIKITDGDSKLHKALGGALIAPEKISPAASRPADFDAFWDGQLKKLAAIPPNPQVEHGESGKPKVDYWKITLDNIGDTHIQGQLARPKEGEKFPALLIPQWAGVYPLQKSWATDRAAEGWLVLNIAAHDLPIDQPEAFYKDQFAGPLKDYWAMGNDDRDTSYFLRMYLSCYQAAQYLTSRPDWDGKTLVVSGTSQGGQQTLMLAGLYPKITAALALVPAGCDMLGPDVGRAPGWPAWYSQTQGKDPEKVRQTARYFDVENFTPRIQCPVLVGMGLIDQVCPPAATFAALDQLQSPKEIIVLPQGEHQELHNSHRPYYQRWGAWMEQLRRGMPAPIKTSRTAARTSSALSSSSAKTTVAAPQYSSDDSPEYLPPTRENYLKLATETEAALHRNVLDPWFPRCVDNEHGGFYSDYTRDWKPSKSEGKFSVFQGRMTWITAEVALRRPELKDEYLPYTRYGEKFLNDVMWDKQSGGIFWGLDDDGKITPSFGDDKQLYGIGFCLYAAANSYRATKDPAALDLAQRIFRWVDQHAHDDQNGGYFEWLKRDGTPIQPDPNAKQPDLRSGLPVGGKSMNTHIHYLETLAQLYQVWPDPAVRKRLDEVLSIVRDKICREPGVMHLYFTFDWQPTSDRDSYGHDIETAYLLIDAAEALGAASDPKTQHMARLLVDHCLQTGWDETNGGVYQEGPMLGKADALTKEWWEQVEALNALLLMHEKYGQETDKYFKAFQQEWHFIQAYQFDHEYPGVIESVQPDGKPITQDKGRMWKAAYHDGRALLNVTDRLKKLGGQN